MSTRRLEYLPLSGLIPAERNPKDHDLASIAHSIVRYGVTSPAEIDERTGRLVVGHGRREVLIRMRMTGEDRPAGVGIADDGDWTIPVLRGWSSRDDTEAEAYIIAQNQIGTAGGWYMRGLAEMVEDIITDDAGLLETLGFTDEDIDDIIRRVDPETLGETEEEPETDIVDDVDEEGDGVPDPDAVLDEDPVTTRDVTCPLCQHQFEVSA